MIEKKEFYADEESPSSRKRDAIWRSIRRSAAPLRSEAWLVRDRRSFVYGMAASIILGLALIGAWTVAGQAFENARPQPLRIEQAYMSAIREFERVIPAVGTQTAQSPRSSDLLTDRKEQLKLIDAAISELRRQTNGTDLSPRVRERLRGLYSKELQILQQMIIRLIHWHWMGR